MQKIILFFLLVSALYSGEMGWTNDYAAAKAQALKEGKVIYVLITTPQCRWCKKLKRTTLSDPEVARRLEQLAVPVEATRGVDNYPPHLKAPMVPMSFFLSTDGRVLVKIPGYWDTEDFMSVLDDVQRKGKE